jgi:hypothetical protein
MKSKKTIPVDNTKPIRVHKDVHQTFLDRATALSMERGLSSAMSLPAYLQEASAFFETNRTK